MHRLYPIFTILEIKFYKLENKFYKFVNSFTDNILKLLKTF